MPKKIFLGMLSILVIFPLLVGGCQGITKLKKPSLKEKEEPAVIGKEGYTSKEIVSSSWGDGSGEFGLNEEAEKKGPQGLTVSPRGEIYLTDFVNGRVLKFSKEGEYISSFAMAPVAEIITLDKEGNFYLYSASNNTVTKYNPQGGKVLTFSISSEISGLVDIWLDKNGGVFVIDADQRTFQIGLANRAFPPAQQVASVKEGRIGPGGLAYLAEWENDHLGYLRIKSDPEKVVKEVKIKTESYLSTLSIIYIDNEGNIYLVLDLAKDKDFKKTYFEVRKYDGNGELLVKIRMPFAQKTVCSKAHAVDEDGNIYQLQTLDSGVKVVRWEKK